MKTWLKQKKLNECMVTAIENIVLLNVAEKSAVAMTRKKYMAQPMQHAILSAWAKGNAKKWQTPSLR